ncbi:hypothetical protein STEG23_012478 [Scotinomys teguina]
MQRPMTFFRRQLSPSWGARRTGRSTPGRAYQKEKRSPNFTTASAMHRSHFLPRSDSDMFPTGNSRAPHDRPPRSD